MQSYTRGWQVSSFLWILSTSDFATTKPVFKGFHVSWFTRPVNSWESWNTTRGVRRPRPPSQRTGMAHRYWRHGGRASAWVPPSVQIHRSVWNSGLFSCCCLTAWWCHRDSFNEARPVYCRCLFLFNPTLFCWSHSCHFSCSLSPLPPPLPLLSLSLSFHFLFTPSTCLTKHLRHPDRLGRSWDV